ncbi:CDP-alcohol phosphatidyltransferase family protein [Streptomyces cyaneofuscatus]|uniref:CDP-alcohol phosphatidyltransferase family protein n=1 Tax=Streptomyces cyaneofuscatus TaxID=66883 RepID=UPI0033A472E5
MALISPYEIRLLRPETTAGAGGQLVLLILLDVATGLSAVGWAAGVAFAVTTWALLTRARSLVPPKSFGPANAVTLIRTTLVGGVTALVAESFAGDPRITALVSLTTVALLLDAVDGQVARRTGTQSAFGARFDMEADAFLILILSVHVAASLGAWVLLIGSMRYVFVAAARPLPWLNGPLPPSGARKTVAVLQGVILLTAAADLLPLVAARLLVLSALISLIWSFGRDVRGLWYRRGHGRTRAARPHPRRATPVEELPYERV